MSRDVFLFRFTELWYLCANELAYLKKSMPVDVRCVFLDLNGSFIHTGEGSCN